MKRKITTLLLTTIFILSLAACNAGSATGPGETPQQETEQEPENEIVFDLDNYKSLVSDCRARINTAGLMLGNAGQYEVNYWKTYSSFSGNSPASDEIAELAFEWLAEQTDENRETVDATYNEIREKYKEIILIELEGKEAEEIDSEFREMYNAYIDLYSLVTLPTGTLSGFSRSLSACLSDILSADEALSLFLD